MRILAICSVALSVCAGQVGAQGIASATSDSKMTASDSAAVVLEAWRALMSEYDAPRVAWLWTPSNRDTSQVIPFGAGVTNALVQEGVPASSRRPLGRDTAVFRLTDWKAKTGREQVKLKVVSELTTVLGSGTQRCRTRSGNVQHVLVTRSGGSWKAERVGPVLVGDGVCKPFADVSPHAETERVRLYDGGTPLAAGTRLGIQFNNEPLIILVADGRGGPPILYHGRELNPDQFKSIIILKAKEARERFGDQAPPGGVILIETK